MPKVSVIVPVYGVERYIERCARSLFEQTLEDMEFIFVDDCSKDKSIELLKNVIKEYPHRNKQVKIIKHDVNKGLPQARKTGVYVSTGEYISHCDSDDWMALNAYEILYERAKLTDAEMVFFDYCRTDGKTYEDFITSYEGLSREDVIVKMIAGQILFGVVFHLDKRHLYFDEDFEWPEYSMTEDLLFTCQLLSRAKSFIKENRVFYYYYDNSNSLTKSQDSEIKRIQSGGNIAKLIHVFENSNLSNKSLCVLLCKMFMKHRYIDGVMTKEGYNRWLNIYPEVKLGVIFDKRVPSVMRKRFILGYTRTYHFVKKFVG